MRHVAGKQVRIGTRGSPLALAQATQTRRLLVERLAMDPDLVTIHVIKTSGDAIQDRALSEAGGKGLFTKELEQALLDGDIELAVHSSKDMPTTLPSGLVVAAYLEREDPRDVLIAHGASTLAELPHGARIGTASLRRQAMARRLRPDLRPVLLRGNVQTRLRKIEDGAADATLLALAGLKRLGLADLAMTILPMDEFLPAVGQGAVCIETRQDDTATRSAVESIAHRETAIAVDMERAFLAELDGSCRTPIAGYCRIVDGAIDFRGMILRPDGSQVHETSSRGAIRDALAMGRSAGEELRAVGGPGFFA